MTSVGSRLTPEQFAEEFWKAKGWVQNGTYPDWPYAVYEFIMSRGLKRIIEVGPGTGAVTYAVALTTPSILVCVDDERENNLLSDVGEVILRTGCRAFTLYRGKSGVVLPALVGEYDLLIHDGEHSYWSVFHDCGDAFRLGCRYVIVHDSNLEEVDRAIRDLKVDNGLLLKHSGFPRVLECRR